MSGCREGRAASAAAKTRGLKALTANLSDAAGCESERRNQDGEEAMMRAAQADTDALQALGDVSEARTEAEVLRIALEAKTREVADLRAALADASRRTATGEGPKAGQATRH